MPYMNTVDSIRAPECLPLPSLLLQAHVLPLALLVLDLAFSQVEDLIAFAKLSSHL
jgi:hypothetical protein